MDYLQYALMGLGGFFFVVVLILALIAAYCWATSGSYDEQIYKISVAFMAAAVVLCMAAWWAGISFGTSRTAKRLEGLNYITCDSRHALVEYIEEVGVYSITCIPEE